MKAKHPVTLGLAYLALLAQTGCEHNNAAAPEPKKPKLVFITIGGDSFWHAATPGIEAAAQDFKVEFAMLAANTLPESQSLDVDGIALSPINGWVRLASQAGASCLLAVDHYKAGRKAGTLAKEVLSTGDKIVIYSETRHSASLERGAGLVDELSDAGALVIEASSIAEHLDAALILALSASDVTACLKELCAHDKLGRIKVIALEENAATREALAAGHVCVLVTSQPYQYGYHAVRVLAALARGDGSVLPKHGFLELPPGVWRNETASHTAARALHSSHDSTLFPRPNAGHLDRTAQAGNLAADRTARERSALR